MCAEYYENPTMLSRVTAKNVGDVFLRHTVVITRMQDLAFEFSKFSVGDTPAPSQREGAAPSRTQHPARPLTGRGAQAPWC